MKRLGALVAASCAACSPDTPPHSTAQRIGKLEQTIGGPHAIGQIGDFLLENDQVRFIIADKGVGRVNTTFGGTMVDADLQRIDGPQQGNDELAELLPGFVFTVINPTDVSVTADGADGGPAEVTVTGIGGDMFEMVALLNTGIVFPSDLTMTQTYRLEPGKRYVTIETTIQNNASGEHPFPYLQPSQLDNLLGMNVPGIANLMLSAPLGQFPLIGGEQKLFAPGRAGFDIRFAVTDSYNTVGGFPAFPGLVVDYLASKGPGVSYGLALPDSQDNYVNNYATGYPGQTVTAHSMLLPFNYAGVTGAYMYKPPDMLGPGEKKTFESYFIVGKGDVGSIYDAILEQRQTPTGTFGGRVLDAQTLEPVAGASVMVLDGNKQPFDELDTDAGGNFLGHLPAGNYSYTVVTDQRHPSTPQPFSIAAGEQTGELIQLDPPATIAVEAVDELGRHAPAKIQLIGHNAAIDGIDGRNILYSLPLGEHVRPTAFDGTDRYVENAWWTVDGRLEAQVVPGTYDLVVSRGPEYEFSTTTVQLGAGQYDSELVQLQRAYTSDGWVAGDFHIHSQPSTDSGQPITDRVTSCAAEGLEVAVATDHNFITDYAPVIAGLGLDQWLLGIPGMELTTFEMGHFNGYPLKVDPGSTRGGEFLWYQQTPGQLFTTLRNLAIDPNNSIVQVNHPRQAVLGYFAQFFVDQDTAQPYTPTGIMGVFAPYGAEFQAGNFSYDFDALELITGRRIEDVHTFVAPNPLPPGPFPDPQPVPGQVVLGKDGHPTFPGTVETWMTLLNRGHEATGMGTSDSHHMLGDEPGYARTLLYVGSGNDTPGGFTRANVIDAIKAHHAVATNGPFIDMTIDRHIAGETIVKSGAVGVQIHVMSASWARPDQLVVYMNGAIVDSEAIPPPAAGHGVDFTKMVTVNPTIDSWVVAEVTGTQNMFPVLTPTEFPPLDVSSIIQALSVGIDLSSLPIASTLKPNHTHFTTPYAITNPIWLDIDGNGWQPPSSPLPRVAPTRPRAPDVRAVFGALPDVAP